MQPQNHSGHAALQRLEGLPRVALTPLPTPFHRVERFAAAIGADVWMKRDDIGSVGHAGNKVRKYELLLGEALEHQADTLITVGAIQSNSARAGAAAAAQLGLRCILVLTGEPPTSRRANLLLDELFGAEIRLVGNIAWSELTPILEAVATEVRRDGGRPYVAPIGASSPLGSLGFALAYGELLQQLSSAGLMNATAQSEAARARPEPALIHATTSGGTHAGLVLGRALHGRGPQPIGIDAGLVLPDPAHDLALLATDAAALVGFDHRFEASQIMVELGYSGPSYGAVTEPAVAAIKLLARTEAIVADPVYSGKALAALVDQARAGRFDGRPVVFWHTGGWQANFDPHYGDALG